MAITDKTIFNSETGYQRGTQRLDDIDHDRIANAIRYLSYAKLYYPLEYGFFTKSLATRGATESMEDGNYILALYDFESYFREFLRKHPGVEQDVNRLSPKEMVDRVDEELVESARARRDAIRKASQRIVNKTIEQQGLKLNKGEKAEAEKAVGAAIQTSIDGAPTTKEFLQSIEESVAPVMLTQIPTADKSAVAHVVGTVLRENPKEIQLVFLSDEKSQKEILDRVVFSSLPNKRAAHAIISELSIGQNETKKQFLDRAEAVARTAMVISSDLSQTPAARAEPSDLISTILEARGNKDVLRAFGKLTEQAKNMVSLAVVSKSWEAAVEVITQRAGGTATGALEEIIKQGNIEWGARSGEPLGKAGSAVAGVLREMLTPAFINYIDTSSLLQTLGGQDGNRVAAFIKSLPAAQHDEGAASAALFLAITTTWRPGDLQFEWQQAQGGGGLGAWAVHVAKDSVLEKLFSKFVKSKAVEAAGGVVKKGGASLIAGLLTKLGLSAAADIVITIIGTPVATAIKWAIQAAIWLGGYIWRPVSNFLGKLTRGEIAQLGAAQSAIKQTLDSWLGPRPPAQPKKWYEQDWVVAMFVVVAAVFLPMLGVVHLFTARDSALFVAGYNNRPEGFTKFNQTFSQPPTYIDPSLFVGREFNCLSFGQGLDTGEGISRGLTSGEVDRITSVVSKYPQINLLSCGLSCPSRKINITAFSEPSDYGGFAPSLRPGNVILYQHTFTGYDDQTFAYLLLHELAHQHDWFNTPIETGFGSLGCGSAPPSTYGYLGNSAEAFAESVALYLINNPEITTYCGGRAYNYLNGAFNQCR